MEVLWRERITHVVTTKVPAGPDQVPGWIDRLEPFLRGIGQCVQTGQLHAVWQSERYVILEVRAADLGQTNPDTGIRMRPLQ